ncbi:MAG: biotin--[acetyl-CoA-carboxylase] ligase [Cyanosarcina radialis HA8281-LM2]|jgi:BirA family biotin operon repressor/biotin-[acetyl-CoA-carboxylase] ligase|nr:biotin--[acetyl-CoA-carboxylase] ligase [Cyanosarcina radialis HA8281-LM2]
MYDSLTKVVLDPQLIKSSIGGYNYAPLDLEFHIFDTLPSTNQTLWDLIDRGAVPGTVVIALQQTAGKGQWGKQWESPLGGLYLSLALVPNLLASESAQLTLCSAWGIATALRARDIPVFIKRPNDLMLSGRKLGGILTEARVQHEQISSAVVGVGINWTNPVPEIGINLESFLETQSTRSITSLEMLAGIALEGLLSGYQSCSVSGMETILPSYLQLLSKQIGNQG